jgi:dolichol-phosphate mannosyltransferase
MPRLAQARSSGDIPATIILPAHNEAAALPTVLSDLKAVLHGIYEVIVVDDGSTDETAQVAREHRCRLVRHRTRRGKGAAIRTGIAQAQGRKLIIMDADATYPASAIPHIIELLAEHDLVRCNREDGSENMPLINRVGNWIFNQLLAGVHGLEGRDHLSGLYGLRREAALKLDLQSDGFDIEAEIAIKARARQMRVATFPIAYLPRLGAKKLRPWSDGLAILGRILALVLLFNPMVTFVLPGVVFMLLALASALVLQRGPVVTPFFGLSIHSFIVTTLGVLAAFQLAVFGMAAALYGVEAGYRPPGWLVFASSRALRLSVALIGFGMAVSAALYVAGLIVQWVSGGAGAFEDTRAIVLASTIMVWGLQILSAALFLSIFAGRLQKHRQPEDAEADDAEP